MTIVRARSLSASDLRALGPNLAARVHRDRAAERNWPSERRESNPDHPAVDGSHGPGRPQRPGSAGLLV